MVLRQCGREWLDGIVVALVAGLVWLRSFRWSEVAWSGWMALGWVWLGSWLGGDLAGRRRMNVGAGWVFGGCGGDRGGWQMMVVAVRRH